MKCVWSRQMAVANIHFDGTLAPSRWPVMLNPPPIRTAPLNCWFPTMGHVSTASVTSCWYVQDHLDYQGFLFQCTSIKNTTLRETMIPNRKRNQRCDDNVKKCSWLSVIHKDNLQIRRRPIKLPYIQTFLFRRNTAENMTSKRIRLVRTIPETTPSH